MLKEIAKAFYNRFFTPRYPLGLTIYLTNRCNLKCAFCEIGLDNLSGSRTRTLRELSREEIDACMDLCGKTGIRRIYITGGEPFLAKNLWYLLESCRERRLIVDDITTNGTLFESLDSDRIRLINDVVRDIIVSIDSADPVDHDRSRGAPGTFEKIERFFLDSGRRDLFRPEFSFNTVVHRENVSNLKAIIDLGKKWSVLHINFQPVCTTTIFPDMEHVDSKQAYGENIDPDRYRESMEALADYADARGVSTNLAVFKTWTPFYFRYLNSGTCFINHLPGKFTCSKVYNYIHVNYNGDLLPCANLEPLANLGEEDFFLKWQKKAQALKSVFRSRTFFPQCASCFCDFPANFRMSLLYFPFANLGLSSRLGKYYIKRARTF